MENATTAGWNETWTLTRAGNFLWLGASLIGTLCLVAFRSRPSNGMWAILTQLFLAEIVTVTIGLISEGLNLTKQEPLLASVMLWWQTLISIFNAGVLIRYAALLGFKREPFTKVLMILSWVGTFLIAVAMTTLSFLQFPTIAFYTVTAYVAVAFLTIWITIMREWFKTACGSKDPERRTKVVKAKSVFAGLGRTGFTTLGHIGILAGIAAFIVYVLGYLQFNIWRYEFLTNLISSALFMPMMVIFTIWSDCPANVKMAGIGEELDVDWTANVKMAGNDGETNKAFEGDGKEIPLSDVVVGEIIEMQENDNTGVTKTAEEPEASKSGEMTGTGDDNQQVKMQSHETGEQCPTVVVKPNFEEATTSDIQFAA